MEAKETVLTPDLRMVLSPHQDNGKLLAEQQAEISFPLGEKQGIDKGRKEVVDWLKLAAAEADFMLDAWQAKLKEWGIEK